MPSHSSPAIRQRPSGSAAGAGGGRAPERREDAVRGQHRDVAAPEHGAARADAGSVERGVDRDPGLAVAGQQQRLALGTVGGGGEPQDRVGARLQHPLDGGAFGQQRRDAGDGGEADQPRRGIVEAGAQGEAEKPETGDGGQARQASGSARAPARCGRSTR